MKKVIYLIITLFVASACNDYLDITPSDIPTLEKSFKMRVNAERNLFTCFSFMPRYGDTGADPAFMGADELWHFEPIMELNANSFHIATGDQTSINPYCNYWNGSRGGRALWQGIRYCNTFLEKIHTTVDLDDIERAKWIAEVKFLKAYYHFYLLKMYGPIPFVDENIDISSGVEDVKSVRLPVDELVTKIIALVDEGINDLPAELYNPVDELGRPTQVIAKTFKADVLLTVASPLFNGNEDYRSWTTSDGQELVNSTFDNTKWEKAALACKEAIDAAHTDGSELYYFKSGALYGMNDTTVTRMNIRQSICEPWNKELLWGFSISPADHLQKLCITRVDPRYLGNGNIFGSLSPTLNIVSKYYTNNGVPIDEDKTWDYQNKWKVAATSGQDYDLVPDFEIPKFNQNREPRFYASIGMDGAYWFGQGKYEDEDMYALHSKYREHSGKKGITRYSITGYHLKKLVHYQNVATNNSLSITKYAFPIYRLADLYLMYAEALNEANGPSAEVFDYLDQVRERAGLAGVQESWTAHSKMPDKPGTKEGLREIIHQERTIELAFESKRYWDLRRWKTLLFEMDGKVQGWNIHGETTEDYYQLMDLYDFELSVRDYFSPIKDSEILKDTEIGQTFGWN